MHHSSCGGAQPCAGTQGQRDAGPRSSAQTLHTTASTLPTWHTIITPHCTPPPHISRVAVAVHAVGLGGPCTTSHLLLQVGCMQLSWGTQAHQGQPCARHAQGRTTPHTAPARYGKPSHPTDSSQWQCVWGWGRTRAHAMHRQHHPAQKSREPLG
jgi:hypothetical protein